ncbi:MAG: heavy-metal-associated domain-containing protein [Weeksellaceae bacterium]
MRTIKLKITGMHCTSCAMNIDGVLEDLGVQDVQTNYAKGESTVVFDEENIKFESIQAAIEKLGYTSAIL